MVRNNKVQFKPLMLILAATAIGRIILNHDGLDKLLIWNCFVNFLHSVADLSNATTIPCPPTTNPQCRLTVSRFHLFKPEFVHAQIVLLKAS